MNNLAKKKIKKNKLLWFEKSENNGKEYIYIYNLRKGKERKGKERKSEIRVVVKLSAIYIYIRTINYVIIIIIIIIFFHKVE